MSPGTVRSLVALREFDLDRLSRLRLPEPIRHEIERLLSDHIRYHLDLTLKADRFVESLGRWRPPERRSGRRDGPEGDGDDQ